MRRLFTIALLGMCLSAHSQSFTFSDVAFLGGSQFNFSDVSGLWLYLVPDDIGLTEGAAVSQWIGRNGGLGSQPVKQVVAAAQPKYGLNRLGGKATVWFDGNDSLTNEPPVPMSNLCVFAVFCSSNWNSTMRIMDKGYSTGFDLLRTNSGTFPSSYGGGIRFGAATTCFTGCDPSPPLRPIHCDTAAPSVNPISP